MYARMDKNAKIYLSMCDESGRLSIPGLFNLFIDAAGEHGTEIGLGMDDLAKKGLFWLAVKTKIQVSERPALLDEVRLYAANTLTEMLDRGVKDFNQLKTALRDELSRMLYKKTGRRPMVLPILLDL